MLVWGSAGSFGASHICVSPWVWDLPDLRVLAACASLNERCCWSAVALLERTHWTEWSITALSGSRSVL